MKWLNILGLAVVITVNALANILPLNGMTTGEVSALYPNYFVPAGITFSIWTLIYLFLAGYCVYPFFSKNADKAVSISGLFLATCVLNSTWIFAWHYRLIALSLCIMVLLLLTLCLIYIKVQDRPPRSKKEKWLVYKPFSIYLAWISVATIANATALLVAFHFSPPTPENWAIAMILATQFIVYLISKKYKDIAFALVIAWALTGIIIKRNDTGMVFDPITIAAILAIIFDVWIALHYRYRKTVT